VLPGNKVKGRLCRAEAVGFVLYKRAVLLYKCKAGFRGGQVAQAGQSLTPLAASQVVFWGAQKHNLQA